MSGAREDLHRRRPVWRALSELFLDTELQELDLAWIASVLAESNYTDEELHDILFREVFPACIPNLRHPAGEWAGFDMEWLEQRVLHEAPHSGAALALPPPGYGMIEPGWRTVLALLPGARRMPDASGS
ncbi:DUF7079 family protein [Aquisphaera giovannonii]